VVVRVMRRMAERGRTVITTIHQPSAELFFMMDQLLLLQRGGWQVYFGPVGARGRDLARYLESVPGAPRCPRKMNPASWMLDVLAGTDSSGEPAAGAGGGDAIARAASTASRDGAIVRAASNVSLPPPVAIGRSGSMRQRSAASAAGRGPVPVMSVPAGAIDPARPPPSDKSPGPVDYQAILRSTPLWAAVSAETVKLATPAPGSKPYAFDSVFARSFAFQLATLLGRFARSYWRNADYNFTRIFTLCGEPTRDGGGVALHPAHAYRWCPMAGCGVSCPPAGARPPSTSATTGAWSSLPPPPPHPSRLPPGAV
jgi:hypothetical protein